MNRPVKDLLPLLTVGITTVLSLVISYLALSSGIYYIFQNLFYIPIILACILYRRRGLVFSVLLAGSYLFMLITYAGAAYLSDGLIRVLIFIVVAIIVSLLAEKSRDIEEYLMKMNDELFSANKRLEEMNTRLVNTEKEMMEQYNELLETQKALNDEITRKTDFLMVASHELRTPLQPALGYLSLLTAKPESFNLSPDVLEMLIHCQRNINKERMIIDRVLELSVLDSGKITPRFEPIYLHTFLEEIIRASGGRTDAEIRNHIPADVTISGDESLLYQVFTNLITNAIRFNNPPREVTLKYSRDEQGHAISVTDNGIGIDSTSQERIFEPFHLVDIDNLSRQYNRLGLGLPIAHRYTDLHGGEITIRSRPGEGSTFTVRLPEEPHISR
ncbi:MULTISPECIES: sensor histidine kinase [Methanocalculus]|uniref:sensor histidine kinase n=1 Tax=Methanocalculus TaxID=71151 RepID=UPI00209F6A04|nr:HAMP domain-containing sensor histidine kinase [Methanocalculus sp. AMF5]MCP1661409.1 signal transduction histidine kinase [Methanocalculus sp. AMF5]